MDPSANQPPEFPPVVSHTPGAVLARIAMPFCLFSLFLAMLLAVSSVVLLPRFTRIEVGGVSRDVVALRAYRDDLVAKIKDMEDKRHEYMNTVREPAYRTILEHKRARPEFLRLREDVTREAAAAAEQPDAVHITMLHYQPERGDLTFAGDVRFVGPRSMTVLAEFVDALARLPFVAATTQPSYDRQEDPKTGPHSPFTLTLQIQ